MPDTPDGVCLCSVDVCPCAIIALLAYCSDLMAKKSRFTDSQKRAILVESVAIGDSATAKKYGINNKTLYRWRKEIDQEELDRAIEESGPFSAEFNETIELSTQFLNELLKKAIANVRNMSDRGEDKAIAAYHGLFKACADLNILKELERDSEDD